MVPARVSAVNRSTIVSVAYGDSTLPVQQRVGGAEIEPIVHPGPAAIRSTALRAIGMTICSWPNRHRGGCFAS